MVFYKHTIRRFVRAFFDKNVMEIFARDFFLLRLSPFSFSFCLSLLRKKLYSLYLAINISSPHSANLQVLSLLRLMVLILFPSLLRMSH